MRQPVLAGLIVLGDLSIQGNIKAVRSLAEPLQIGMDNGARCALIPLENKRHFLDVTADVIGGSIQSSMVNHSWLQERLWV